MLRTLENRRLVDRDASGAWLPGAGLAVLATNVVPEIRSAAQPVLEALANDTAMTSFLVIRDHDANRHAEAPAIRTTWRCNGV